MPFSEPLQLARKTHWDMIAAAGIKGVAGTCLYATIVLQMMVDLHAGRPCAVIRGGDGEAGGGYVDATGRIHGHYWVEATEATGRRYVLDVTADQFGGPQQVHLALPLAARQYIPGDQALVDLHVAGERRLAEMAADSR
ncbi:MAG: hypothetical protein ACRER5_02910 [Pseudomonas sp.]